MIIDGHDLGQWVNVNPKFSLLPGIEDTTVTVPGRDGSMHVRTRLKPLDITVTVRLAAPPCSSEDVAHLWRELKPILFGRAPKKISFPHEPDLYYMASLVKAGSLSNLWYTGECDLTYRAYDPVAYGKERSCFVVLSTTVSVDGTEETYPVFELTATGSTFRLTDYATGRYIALVSTPKNGNKIVIDMDAETVRLNGSLQTVNPASDFFPLQPGDNDIRISGASGTVRWTERWL